MAPIESPLDVAIKVTAFVGCVLGIANTGWLLLDRRQRLRIVVNSHSKYDDRGAVRATIINPNKNVIHIANIRLMALEPKNRKWKFLGETRSGDGEIRLPQDLEPSRRLDVVFSAHATFPANLLGRFCVEVEVESGKCFRSKMIDAQVGS